ETWDMRKITSKRPARELIEYASPSQIGELMNAYIELGEKGLHRHPAYRQLYSNSPFDRDEILIRLRRIKMSMYDSSYMDEFRQKISEAMAGTQVLYLPTYRRIEADFEEVSLRRNTPLYRRGVDVAEED